MNSHNDKKHIRLPDNETIDLILKKHYNPWKLTVIYGVFGILWILLSDEILALTVKDHDTYQLLQLYKGWFYILITSLLFYGFAALNNKKVLGLNQKIQFQNEELWAANEELVAMQDSLEMTIAERTQELIAANNELIIASKQSSANQIVRNLLHRINTPLGNTITYTDLLQSNLNKRQSVNFNLEESVEVLKNIRISQKQIVLIMDTLKNMLQIDHFEEPTSIDLSELIPVIFYDAFTSLEISDDSVLSIHYPNITIQLPEKNLHIALSNLALFAKHQRDQNSKLGKAALTISVEPHQLKMIYDDPTLSQLDNLKHIFDPYAYSSFNNSNAGMELSILYNCVTIGLGGTLSLIAHPENEQHHILEIRLPLSELSL